MNRIFRIIWSQALSTWVVVSELATGRGKRSGGAEVDERVAPQALVLDRDMVEGSPPATAWPLRIGVMLALLSLYAPAEAANRYWDVNGTTLLRGGTGTWNTTSPFWSPNGDGVSGPYSAWNNGALDDAFFGGTAGTVTLGTPITVHNLTFETAGYNLTGGTLTLGGATPTITTNAGVGATINSIIAGSAGLTKAGTGNLALNGVNTFTGGVNVTAGGLFLNGDAALGAASNGVTLAGGTTLNSTGSLSGRVVTLTGGTALIGGGANGAGSAFFTGAGGLNTAAFTPLTNDANNYTGQTLFTSGSGAHGFTSIADLGVASSLGAPVTVANGTINVFSGGFNSGAQYLGDGDSSNRNWVFGGNTYLQNAGTGTLTLTGNIASSGSSFNAATADLSLLGVISGATGGSFTGGGVARTITLGTANTYTGATGISNVTVRAGSITNAGVASSLGTNSNISLGANAVLAYTGAGNSSDRTWTISGASTLRNDGSGALALSGAVTAAANFTLGGSFAGVNTLSGVISGAGGIISSGAGTWVLGGANTYTGTTTVNSGTLRAGSAQAFGGANSTVVNGGTLDLNNFSMERTSLSGTGGTVALGSGTLTLNGGSGVNTSYAGSITGSGGLTKVGASTQTLTGANTYTGATTINGGTLRLDFSAAGGPTSDIISSASTLNMAGGTLNAIGAAGEANTQTFNGLFITAGSNTIGATSGTGGSMTINLGDITRTGGLVNFNLPTNGNITTTDTALGGWATVNGTNYAKVVGGNILAFTAADYVNKDNASTWLDNEIISDAGGAANTAYFSTVSGSKQIGGLQYTAFANSTVTVGAGNTLGVDGTIIVASSVAGANQTITGGSLTGTLGGGVLGIQQNGTGTFTIGSQIVDNGGSIGFTKAGTGLVALTNNTSNYTGATIVSGGILSVTSINNGGAASSIGASSAASSNLVLEGSTLRYTGGTTTSDRGFTLAKAGLNLGGTVDVSSAVANLTFNGLVTSADGSNLTKTGAGTLTLGNAGNDYTGVTTVNAGTLAVSTLGNGGLASSIGASSSASSNLVLTGGTLMYTGATGSTDRGFTVGVPGAGGSVGTIGVSNAATTLTVSGTAVGDDGFNKTGAGTLVLSGTNTYTGGNTVTAGTLRAGSTQAFGNVANTMNVVTGGTLDLNGFNNQIGALNGGGAVTLGAATLTSSGGVGTFTGVISGTGNFTRLGGGSQTLSGCNNTYTGVTSISSSTIITDCLKDGGVASGIGASTSASTNLYLADGRLTYTGGNQTTNRGFNLANGTGYINVNTAATTLEFTGTVVGPGALGKEGAGTLVLSGTNTYSGGSTVWQGILRAGSSTAFGSGYLNMANTAGATVDLNGFNISSAWLSGGGTTGGNINLGAQTLTITNGAGAVYAGNINGTGNLVKTGGGIQVFSGCNNSYTGTTTINSGWISTNCLANGGINSGIGASSSAASNLIINGGGFQYTGAAQSSDRLFTLGTAGGFLDSSGTGALNLTNTGAIALAGTNAARTFTLSGTNTGNNTLSAQLTNNGTGATSLTKTGTGTWILTNNNSNYTGVTTIVGGVLGVSQLANGGVASGIGAATSAASNLIIGSGATLRYTGAGDSTDRLFTLGTGVAFIESSGTGAINFSNTGAVTLQGTNTARTIALGGTNTGNNILGGAIGDNGTGQTTLAKNDSGNWILTGNNTYTGNTVINNGNLTIGNGGTTGNLGTGSVIVDSATSTLSMNRSDTVVFNTTMSGPGGFAQIGTGTTTLTANSSIGSVRVSAGTLDVDGTLTSSTIAMTGTSTLNVDGTMQAAGPTTSVITGDAGASTISIGSTGTLRANGDLGDGSDALTVAGTLDTGAALLSLGAGNDTLTINDGAVFTGTGVDGGAGTADNLTINNALALTFGGSGNITGFEQLTKNNIGVLTLTGTQSYTAGTAINGGTLDVDGTLESSTVTMAGGTTLNVDGTVQGIGGVATTLTGTAGVETINVNTGATLRANGDLGDGVDSLTLFGTLDTGASTLSLGAGNETFTLRDGAAVIGAGLNGGAGTDQLLLDNALAMTVGGNIAGFETLLKQNTGEATLNGTHTFIGGTTINGGTLTVTGAMTTPTVVMADNTTLNVDGSLQAGGGTAAAITGSSGANTVTVGVGATLLANGDLGAGNDVLDVFGTLNTVGGTLLLGDGNDAFSIHDGSVVTGTVDGGAGLDNGIYNINLNADIGALVNFEVLTKTGTGTLDLNGPGASNLEDVNVLGGTLNIAAGGSVVGNAGSTLDTVIASGATLNVNGSYGCSTGNDTMNVSGTVSGSGTIDLCGGDDTLTLNDGAVLNSTNPINGGANGVGDRVVLNNAGAFTLDAGDTVNFEFLTKNNTGAATLTGDQTFSGGTTLNGGTLNVAAGSTLYTPTLAMANGTTFNVDGFASGGPLSLDSIAITGSTGVNTVSVAAGGYLAADGTSDLGAGDDVLDVAGVLDVIGGGSFKLGDGNDRLIVHDTTSVLGGIDAGLGIDLLEVNVGLGNTVPLGSLNGFESLGKSGLGTLQINGPSAFIDVEVQGGTLDVTAGASVAAQTTTVFSGATLNLGGDYTGTAGTDTFTVAGTITGGGTLNLLGGNDSFTIQDGADLSGLTTAVDGGAGIDTLTANVSGSATLNGAINFETLTKTNTGTLNIDGPAASSFATVNVNGGTLDIGAAASVTGVQNATVASGASLIVAGSLGFTPGADSFTVAGNISGAGAIDMLDGDDTLTLNDGADMTGFTGTLDGGAGTGDAVVLNNALAMTFGAGTISNFEFLTKNNTGTATLTGTQTFSGGTTLNGGMLDVDGTLTTPTLAMADGTTFHVNTGGWASGGPLFIDSITITGSAGVNTVSVAEGGYLAVNGSGDLGAGDDVLDVAGLLDVIGGAFNLGDGNDRFIVHDTTSMLGGVDAGAGIDLLEVNIGAGNTAELGALNGFESLGKSGLGTVRINGPSAFIDVEVLGGLLDVAAGGSVAAQNTTVSSGATLNLDGAYTGTTGTDTFTVAGTITGSSTLDLLDGNDSFTIQDGADLSGLANAVDGGAGTDTFTANLTGSATLNGAINFETLTKTNTGTLNIVGPTASSFATVNVNGGTLDIGAAASVTGVQNATVASGTTLNVAGSLGFTPGADSFTVAGNVSGAGTIDMLDGNDTLTLNDGANMSGFTGALDGGAGTGDTVVLNNALAMTFGAGTISNFEFLTKNNTGTATLTGTQTFSGGTTLNGGMLDVDGTLTTPTVAMADSTTLNVDGTVQGLAGAATAITGSAGVNIINVAAGANLLASGDLGGSSDVLDVSGTLDTVGGTFGLGDGDDTFTVHDGTVVGTVDGGAGLDTRVYDINLTADLGALLNFEGVTKTGTGTLNINGPGATDLQEVSVLGGTLNVAAGASVVATAGLTLDTVVASGAILNVDGSFGCGTGNDTMNVSGTVQGTGTIDLCGGDDTLTLNDGAVLANVIDGGANGAGDTVVLNNAGAFTFDAGDTINFETLQKDNTGTATLTGAQIFTGGTLLNGGMLDVDGTLDTPTIAMADDTTLNVDGTVQGVAGAASAITGSAGVNTVTVAAGANLTASGDLGAGNDVLDVAGTLDTMGGTFALGDGDDRLIVHDTTAVFGTVDAGLGIDLLEVNVGLSNTVQLGALAGFESLGKSGLGTLQINGPSSFIDVEVLGGTLDVAASGSVAAQNTTVFSGATLNIEGNYTGTAGSDIFAVAGTIIGSGTLDLLAGDDTFTIQDGADLSGLATSVDGGAGTDTFVADLTGAATLGGAINFETLTKTNSGTLNVDGPAASAFTTVNVDGGTLDIGVAGSIDGVITTTVANGATLNVDGMLGFTPGGDNFTIAGAVSGAGTIDMLDGDDTLTLNDGADTSGFSGLLDGGAGTGDTVVLDNALAMTFGVGTISNFEVLTKNNTGTATLTGTQIFTGGTTINGGTLDVDGTLETPALAMADDTTLNVDGLLQGAGGTAATILGSGGVNTVTVGGTLLATGDLGSGNDVLDVVGTLDVVAGGGTFALGDGDDSFVVHDGTVVNGIIDGGLGLDTRVYDINLTADLGALLNFEGVTKTGTGTLNINGPGATDLQEVSVLAGTLNIAAGGSVIATPGASLDTVVASGATLNVDGSYGCGDGNDTMDVSGTVSGSGTVDLCGGDDTLTLNDGAVLANVIDGGANGAGDTVVLNNANAFTFDAGTTINFEVLQKDNTGTATLIGTQSFSGGTTINGGTLDVDGMLETPTVAMGDDTTLNVDGTVQGAGGTAATITGSDGINAVTVNGTLLATGDLGAGNDVLDVAGTLDTAGGTFALGDGDDTLTIHDGTNIIGTVVAGAGNDTFNTDIATSADLGAVQGFETLSKTNVGVLNINGPMNSDFTTVNVLGGTLNVTAGGSVSAQTTTVAAGSTLLVNGTYTGTAGDDVLDVAGTLDAGSGTVALGDGDDTFTIHDGTNVIGTIDGGAGQDSRVYDINLSADLGALVNFEGLTKTGTGTLNINGPGATDLQEVEVLGGVLNIGPAASVVATAGSTLDTMVASGATLNVDGSFGCGAGNDTMSVSGTVSGSGTIDLCDGEDTLTLDDGAVLNTVISGGTHGAGDTVVLNSANALNFDATNTINFEHLQKDNTGTATLIGTQSFSGGTTLNGGTLDVDGTLETPTVALADDTMLNVDGLLQAGVGTAATLTGSAGTNTVTVTGTLLATGDLGAGNDVLDVAGTLDTVGGVFALGDGDDTLTIHDGTQIIGTVAAGAGNDTFNTDIETSADLGAVQEFETLSKTGVGVLNINGPMSSDFSTVNVLAGTLNVAAGGSVIAQTTTVAAGSTLQVDGSYSGTAGDDTMTVAGTVSGSGTVALGDGNDTLTLQDGADLGGLSTALDGGAGTDTVSAQVAGTMTLGPTVNFETLQKGGLGELILEGDQAYITTQVDAGTLTVTADSTLTSHDTTVDAGATLDVRGSFSGTAGDDTFTSMGTVLGALAFGDGDDTASFVGGDLSGLTELDGGSGSADLLSFSGLDVDDTNLAMTDWERVELLSGSALTLGGLLDLSGGVLAIDANSQLFANAGAGIGGSVENAGLIDVGSNRLTIGGSYTSDNGALALTVSPGTLSAGGLDIEGDVIGNTNVVFASDGSSAGTTEAVSILVIASPNDDTGTAGGFVPTGAVDGMVRLDGSLFPWAFGQQSDNNWYLSTEAAGVLPEIPGYGALPDIGLFGIEENNRLLSQRLSAVRGDAPRCDAGEQENKRAYWQLTGDCHGFWVAATGSELEMGADPGFAFSGDSLGLYVGADVMLQDRGSRTLRGGLFAGFQRGNYWTTGENSTGLPGVGEANVRMDTPTFGMYGSVNWRGGTYADVTLVAQVPEATIVASDGFSHRIRGTNLTVSSQVGHEFQLDNGWTLEPQAQLSVIAMQWEDTVDAGGKQLVMDDDLLGVARVAVRAEKVFETAGGARIRPWAVLGLQDTLGEKDSVLTVLPAGSNTQGLALPNHELGLTATIDMGVEAELNERVSLFGVLSYGESLGGSESEQRQANLGVRIRW